MTEISAGFSRPCICGPDSTGETPDERPDCPEHGLSGLAAAVVLADDVDPYPPPRVVKLLGDATARPPDIPISAESDRRWRGRPHPFRPDDPDRAACRRCGQPDGGDIHD